MKHLIHTLAAASVVLLFSSSAAAQPRFPDRDERYRTFGRATLDRVRADLGRVERHLRYIGEADLRRFAEIRQGLAEFQRKWEHGRYDRGDLDQAIANLHELVDRGRLRPPDRDVLADDLRRLRELRDRLDRVPRG